MINDFFKKFLTNSPIMDDYGLKYNHNFKNEIDKINNEYSASLLNNKVLIKCTGEDAENFLNTQFITIHIDIILILLWERLFSAHVTKN